MCIKMHVLSWLPARELFRSRAVARDFVQLRALAHHLWQAADVAQPSDIMGRLISTQTSPRSEERMACPEWPLASS